MLSVVARALWWRKGVSLTILLVGTLSIAAAAMGPLFARAVQESVLRDTLTQAPVQQSGVDVGLVRSSGRVTAEQMLAQAVSLTSGSNVGRYFAPPVGSVQANPVPVTRSARQMQPDYNLRLAWRDGACAHLRISSGRCPQSPGEVLISSLAAHTLRLRVGERLGLYGLSARNPQVNAPRTVGIYTLISAADRFWFGANYFDHGGRQARGQDVPDQLDTAFVTETSMNLSDRLDVRVDVQRALAVDRIRLAALPELHRLGGTLSSKVAGQSTAGVQLSTSLPALLDTFAAQQRLVNLLVPLVAVQLVGLTWLVLFLLVARTTEERSSEVALSKLRGLATGAAVAFGLAEPLLLLVLSTPLGLALGWLLTRLLVGYRLLPGTPVALTPATFAVVAGALLGAATAAGLAARAVLTRPVLEQLRRTPGGSASLSRSFAIDAVAVAVAAAATYQLLAGGDLTQSRGNGLALIVPGLLAVAASLLFVRLLPLPALLLTRRTRHSTHVGRFLAIRQVARRPALLRTIALLSVAVALATFGLDAAWIAGRNRQNLAEQQVGAATVVHVGPISGPGLLAATRQADPTGRYAMAVQELIPSGSDGGTRLLAVDADRFAAVAAWESNWAPYPVDTLSRRLRPALPPTASFTGTALSVNVATQGLSAFYQGTTAIPPPRLHLLLAIQPTGHDRSEIEMGVLRPAGSQTLTSAVPACTAGCRIAGLSIVEDPDVSTGYFGKILIGSFAADGRPVRAGLTSATGGWHAPISADTTADPNSVPPLTMAGASAAGLLVGLYSTHGAVPQLIPGDTPLLLPAVLASGAPRDRPAESTGAVTGTGLDGQPTLLHAAVADILPRGGRNAVLVDLSYAVRVAQTPAVGLFSEVWLSANAPQQLRQRLHDAGVVITTQETLSDRKAVLDRQGPALIMALFVAAAALALLLGLSTACLSVYVSARRRTYEIAAMRSLGISRRTLFAAAATEQASLMTAGTLMGIVVGTISCALVIPAVPLFPGGDNAGPSLQLQPAWAALAILLVATLGAAGVVGALAAHRLVAASVTDRLRESQA